MKTKYLSEKIKAGTLVNMGTYVIIIIIIIIIIISSEGR
jgi:hypothetical protein